MCQTRKHPQTRARKINSRFLHISNNGGRHSVRVNQNRQPEQHRECISKHSWSVSIQVTRFRQ